MGLAISAPFRKVTEQCLFSGMPSRTRKTHAKFQVYETLGAPFEAWQAMVGCSALGCSLQHVRFVQDVWDWPFGRSKQRQKGLGSQRVAGGCSFRDGYLQTYAQVPQYVCKAWVYPNKPLSPSCSCFVSASETSVGCEGPSLFFAVRHLVWDPPLHLPRWKTTWSLVLPQECLGQASVSCSVERRGVRIVQHTEGLRVKSTPP